MSEFVRKGRRTAAVLTLSTLLAACASGEGQPTAAPTPTGLEGTTAPATTPVSERPFDGPYLEFDDLDSSYPDIYVYPVTESGDVGTEPLGFTFTDGVARAIRCQREARRVYSKTELGEPAKNDNMWYRLESPDVYASGTYGIVHPAANGARIPDCP